jgi:hypothetical protein
MALTAILWSRPAAKSRIAPNGIGDLDRSQRYAARRRGFSFVGFGLRSAKRQIRSAVPSKWPASVWISNLPSILDALSRIFPNPKPSLFSKRAAEMPDPLPFT